ncbi:MAG: flagellar basal body-associated FliL family protein [Lachnospiraceae bacterium]|nr:flagellar basal body-associated FliL family protein [Lachnospiraceae bacterium]
MKKNILAIIILAATLVNLTLSALMLFVYLPNAQKMNTMITKICGVIDMELESPLPKDKEQQIAVTDLESIVVGTNMAVNLTPGADGKKYFAQITATIVLNKKAEDYKKIQPLMEPQAELIKEIIQNRISALTPDNFQAAKELVKNEILADLRESFDTECIYSVVFGSYTMMQ